MNAFKSLLVAAVITAGMAGAAVARDQSFTIRLAQPVAEHTRVIAVNTIWNCDGDTCTARASHASTVRSCRQFVHEAGGVRVTAYGPAGAELNADELARCNNEAPVTQQAAN